MLPSGGTAKLHYLLSSTMSIEFLIVSNEEEEMQEMGCYFTGDLARK